MEIVRHSTTNPAHKPDALDATGDLGAASAVEADLAAAAAPVANAPAAPMSAVDSAHVRPSSCTNAASSTEAAVTARCPEKPTVALFATCVSDVMFPQTPQATVELLERLGCRVEFPEAQSCCGQMFTNTGYFREALDCVRAYVRAFEDYDYVVAPSGSCVAAVREQHPLLAADSGDPGLERAVRRLAGRSFELSEFIIDVLGTEDVGACFPHSVTFHPTCHALRIAGLGDRPLRLLRHVRGLTLLPLSDWEQCCGFGGTFSLKNPDVSASMAAAKAEAVEATGAEFLVTVDNACLMNIGGVLSRSGSRVRTIHLAEVLASL